MFQFDPVSIQNGLKVIETGEQRRHTGEIQGGLMSGNLWVVFCTENDSVEVERLSEGLQGHGGLGPISHREYVNKLQAFISKAERTKERKVEYKYEESEQETTHHPLF